MVLNPAGKPFNEIVSVRGANVPVDAMIIANHRAKNLRDLFSSINIEKKPAPPVSSYFYMNWRVFFALTHTFQNFKVLSST